MKPNINSVEVHLQLSHNRHRVDGVLVGAGFTCGHERLVIATHLDQSNYLANQKEGPVNEYDLNVPRLL